MKHTFTEKAVNLRVSLLNKLGRSWVGKGEEYRCSGWRGYDLGTLSNFEHNALVFVDGKWMLVEQNGHLYSINTVSLDTLCEYADYIIEKYKL